jgi:hypothetical protein
VCNPNPTPAAGGGGEGPVKVTLLGRTITPWFGLEVKYRCPPTSPSFLPSGASSCTPHRIPSLSPWYFPTNLGKREGERVMRGRQAEIDRAWLEWHHTPFCASVRPTCTHTRHARTQPATAGTHYTLRLHEFVLGLVGGGKET